MLFTKLSAFLLAAVSIWSPVTGARAMKHANALEEISGFSWHDPNNTQTSEHVEIAIIKLEADVPVTDPRYGGAIVMNPGGPGASGVEMLTRGGRIYQEVASPNRNATENPGSKFYDLISFDPRGVGSTTPSFKCFSNHIQRALFNLQVQASGVLGSSDAAFDSIWARDRGLADHCSTVNENNIRNHMSTIYVARDIIEIFERHGEWRENEARRILQAHPAEDQTVLEPSPEVPDHLKWKPGKETIQFWGFSYGTVIGSTIAAMYPQRVNRMVLDGNVDCFDWYRGKELGSMQDTDLIIDRFANRCFDAGHRRCALYNASGPPAISQRFFSIIDDLKNNPFPMHGQPGGLVTYADLIRLIYKALYSPLELLPSLAKVMVQIANKDGQVFLEQKISDLIDFETGVQACERNTTCPNSFKTWMDDSNAAVFCTDALPQTDLTREDFMAYVATLKAQSRALGEIAGMNRLPCTQWHARPKWRYEGDFNVTTTVPIMFVGNTADPVTPLRNAFRMSKSFSGSIVLTQDSEGHCSISSPSLCTSRAIRTYFQSGKLPANNTVCAPNDELLGGFHLEPEPAMPEGETDEVLWRAMVGLSRVPQAPRHRGLGIRLF